MEEELKHDLRETISETVRRMRRLNSSCIFHMDGMNLAVRCIEATLPSNILGFPSCRRYYHVFFHWSQVLIHDTFIEQSPSIVHVSNQELESIISSIRRNFSKLCEAHSWLVENGFTCFDHLLYYVSEKNLLSITRSNIFLNRCYENFLHVNSKGKSYRKHYSFREDQIRLLKRTVADAFHDLKDMDLFLALDDEFRNAIVETE